MVIFEFYQSKSDYTTVIRVFAPTSLFVLSKSKDTSQNSYKLLKRKSLYSLGFNMFYPIFARFSKNMNTHSPDILMVFIINE